MGKKVRRAKVTVQYADQQYAENVTRHLESFRYIDVVDGKHTDSLALGFEDSEGHWQNRWFPKRGKVLKAAIVTRDWPKSKTLNCGSFELDDIDFSGPPNVCTISGLAVGITSTLRRQKKTKAWDSINIQKIAQEIANNNGFQLEYEGGESEKLDRFDQREQTDLELITLLCEKYGLGLQITDKKLRIFDAAKRDMEPPEIKFDRNDWGHIRHNLQIGSSDVYSSVELKYLDTKRAAFIKYKFDATSGKWSNEKPPSGYTLKLNERCQSEAEAEKIAKAALREKNKREVTGSITVLGDPDIRAGMTAGVKGFGKLDAGRYFIEQAEHSYDKSGGYTTVAQIRGAVDY